MTPEALLAMPDSDYMHPAQLAFFRARLESMRDEILENVAQASRHLRESQDLPDPADRASQEEEHTLMLRARDRERKLLHKIESALQRIAAGQYGFCEDTGVAIGLQRLLARPTATLCIEAQERHERRERQYVH